jgi:hypothetical protein
MAMRRQVRVHFSFQQFNTADWAWQAQGLWIGRSVKAMDMEGALFREFAALAAIDMRAGDSIRLHRSALQGRRGQHGQFPAFDQPCFGERNLPPVVTRFVLFDPHVSMVVCGKSSNADHHPQADTLSVWEAFAQAPECCYLGFVGSEAAVDRPWVSQVVQPDGPSIVAKKEDPATTAGAGGPATKVFLFARLCARCGFAGAAHWNDPSTDVAKLNLLPTLTTGAHGQIVQRTSRITK